MKEKWAGFWRERNEREKAMLAFVSIFMTASLLYAFVWEPGEKAGRQLRKELPELRSKALQMRIDAEEIGKLRNVSRGGGTSDIRSEIASSAQASHLGLSRIEVDGEGRTHVEFASVPFDGWVAWLDKLGTENHLRLESGHIRKLEEPGMVRIDATFGGGS